MKPAENIRKIAGTYKGLIENRVQQIIISLRISSGGFFIINMYTVYIIYSSLIDKFYTGQTQDIERRLEKYNLGKTSFLLPEGPGHWFFLKNAHHDPKL